MAEFSVKSFTLLMWLRVYKLFHRLAILSHLLHPSGRCPIRVAVLLASQLNQTDNDMNVKLVENRSMVI